MWRRGGGGGRIPQVEIAFDLHLVLGCWAEVYHLLRSAREHLRSWLRLRLRLRGKELSIDSRSAIGVVVECIAAGVGIEDRLWSRG